MNTMSLRPHVFPSKWRNVWRTILDKREDGRCTHTQKLWQRWTRNIHPVLLDGSRYCIDECLEPALYEAIQRARLVQQRSRASHRLPLGLLLLSRQQLTAEQLQMGLKAQRAAGHGKIGEWLVSLGYISEQQVTAALAKQWSCPVLRAGSTVSVRCAPPIPVTLLERCAMVPVSYVETTKTLYMAFGECIDYSVLYVIEQMTGCHTEACMAEKSFVRGQIEEFRNRRDETEVAFDGGNDVAEFTRIVRSYCVRLHASEIRVNRCGPYIWARLAGSVGGPMDLMFCFVEPFSPAVQ